MRRGIVVPLITNVASDMDRIANLQMLSLTAQSILQTLQMLPNKNIAYVELSGLPSNLPNVTNVCLTVCFGDGDDYTQRTYDYCLDLVCRHMIY